jgi:hypothetical protein
MKSRQDDCFAIGVGVAIVIGTRFAGTIASVVNYKREEQIAMGRPLELPENHEFLPANDD